MADLTVVLQFRICPHRVSIQCCISVSQKEIHSDRRLESTSVISESVSVSQKEIHSDRRVESASVISLSVGKIHG